jgi:hypothetical protein
MEATVSPIGLESNAIELLKKHLERGFSDLPWNKKVGLMSDSFHYIEEGVIWMNRPGETHSFTPEKVKEEAEDLIAKTYLLIKALEEEIAKTQKS